MTECQQPSPKPFSCYAAAPNDVWSLGVILVNLTCGRNPWKRASPEDSTFNAFLHDSEFLKSILPLTDDLDCILRRIFECDPAKRITVPELRQMILRCPRFTTHSAPSSPSSSPCTSPVDSSSPQSAYTANSSMEGFCLTPQSPVTPQDEMHHYPGPNHAAYYPAPPQSAAPAPRSYCPAPVSHPPHRAHYASHVPNSWYAPFIPALDLAQKHMSITPFFGGVRVF